MKKIRLLVLGLALGSAVSMAEECVAPDAPIVPEGADASHEQMLATLESIKEFQAANLSYMGCLEPTLSAAEASAKEGDEGAVENYQKIQETYNAAVSAEEEVAAKFNVELRNYKAANPG